MPKEQVKIIIIKCVANHNNFNFKLGCIFLSILNMYLIIVSVFPLYFNK